MEDIRIIEGTRLLRTVYLDFLAMGSALLLLSFNSFLEVVESKSKSGYITVRE